MKQHELLAVETSLENQSKKAIADLANTFEKKRHLFEEKRILFTPDAEDAKSVVEAQSDIQTTVKKELNWLRPFIVKALNASFQVANTNMVAKADIVLEDGTVLVKDVPATSLLELEKRMVELQNFITTIPTLDPAKGFVQDPARDGGIYKAREIFKTRTKKEKRVFVKYEATKEHPAQTELLDQDVVVGKLQEQEWSGLLTPAEKSEYLTRVEEVNRAIRQARSRANDQTVDTSKVIGAQLMGYIFKN